MREEFEATFEAKVEARVEARVSQLREEMKLFLLSTMQAGGIQEGLHTKVF